MRFPEESLKWTADVVKERLGDLFSPEAQPTSLKNYLEAASVLVSFSPATLNPVGGVADREEFLKNTLENTELEFFRKDDPKEAGSKSAWNSEAARWSLTPEVRRQNLARLIEENRLEEAFTANPITQKGLLQGTLEDLLRGKAKDLAQQSLDELRATLQVSTWLKGLALPNELESIQKIQTHIEWETLLKPFRDLVGSQFAGRETEMDTLSDYVAVYEATSFSQATARLARKAVDWQTKPPLFIQGPGGIGKSTLIAQFVLTHAATRHFQRFPFTYFDFDRPGLLVEEPITLLIDAVRQIAFQFPEIRKEAGELLKRWTASIHADETSPSPKSVSTRLFRVRDRQPFFDGFTTLLKQLPNFETLLFILDTFEEVQFRSRAFVDETFDFLFELQTRIPGLRTVIAGRAPLRLTRHKVKTLELKPFDEFAAVAFLRKQGVESTATGGAIFEQVGGSPLTLKLAARLALLPGENVGPGGIEGLDTGILNSMVGDSIQAQLYNRILGHIHDKEVKKLAHPGLILRRITPELILKVLAEPCKLVLKDLGDATSLFNKLKEEIALVDPGEKDSLRHRSDVRAVMVQFLMRDDKERVTKINDLAIGYYSQLKDRVSRGEELYHLLLFDFDRNVVAPKADDEALRSVKRSIDELPPRSQAFVAARVNLERDDKVWKKADWQDWELNAAQQIGVLLALGKPQDALSVLGERKERTPNSPLYGLEIDALLAAGRREPASSQIERLIQQALRAGPDSLLVDALVRRVSAADSEALEILRRKVTDAQTLVSLLADAHQRWREPRFTSILWRWSQTISGSAIEANNKLGSSVSAFTIPPTPVPKLNCRFKIDRSGTPKSYRAEGLNNYDIEIFATDFPENARTVTYYLDESYGDESIFTKRTVDKDFLETIESYGDFELIAMVELSGNREPIVIHRKLSDALRDWHQSNGGMTEVIKQAIEDVQKN